MMTRFAPALAVVLACVTTSAGGQSGAAFLSGLALEDPVLEAIAAAAGMPALESAVLPLGYREIRMRTEQGMICCDAHPMLRLVEGPREIRGSLWLFRTLVLLPNNPAPRDDERCEPLREQHICVRPWKNLSAPEWAVVAARLDELGAWALDAPCNRPKTVVHDDGSITVSVGLPGDAGDLSVQRLEGGSVTAFSCAGPQLQNDADGLKANALYEYFRSLGGKIPTERIRIAR